MEQEKVNLSEKLNTLLDTGLRHSIQAGQVQHLCLISPGEDPVQEDPLSAWPCPVSTSEPKACVLQSPQTTMHILDLPAGSWHGIKFPRVLLSSRRCRLLQPSRSWRHMMEEDNMITYVKKKVLEDPIRSDDNFGPLKRASYAFRDDIFNQTDFCHMPGGGRTLLFWSWPSTWSPCAS